MAHARLIIVLSLVVSIIVFAALTLASCQSNNGSNTAGARKTERVVIGGHTFDLEVSADPATRELGLMHRATIDEQGGMIFIFPDAGVAVQNFWMKNCLADIDIIYLDPRGKVTATHRMKARPPRADDESEADYNARIRADSYSSGYPAQFAIELKSGWLDQLNLKVEDQLPLDLDRLKAMAR